ncbi:MAG: hypothetical protein ACOCP8_04180 [archaeon]
MVENINSLEELRDKIEESRKEENLNFSISTSVLKKGDIVLFGNFDLEEGSEVLKEIQEKKEILKNIWENSEINIRYMPDNKKPFMVEIVIE